MPKLLVDGPGVVALGGELVIVLAFLFPVERLRSSTGPQAAIATARRMGQRWGARGPARRALLRKAIRWSDRRLFAESNCYRRVLLEIALDRGAATEKVMMGFREGGGTGSGHAWLESDPPVMTYDAIVSV
jgi:Transglutaminase-like superfamily